MKKFWSALSGMVLVLAVCVVPSFASSSTPSYPSGTGYGYFVGSSPSSSPSSSASNFFTAVTAGLTNGFSMVSRGLYNLYSAQTTYNSSFNQLKARLVNASSFSYISSNGTSTSSTSGVLDAINYNSFYGFKNVLSQLNSANTKISAFDDRVAGSFKNLIGKLESLSEKELSALELMLRGDNTTSTYWFGETPVKGGFPMIHRWLSKFYDLAFDPVDEELKDASEDQKNELLDEFFGDDSNGVKPGQIGSLGDVSSSAGSLLDTGGNLGNIFDVIGDAGSSVWSWFSSDNAMAINGPDYVPPPPPEPPSTPEPPVPTEGPGPSPEPSEEPSPSPEPSPSSEPSPSPGPTEGPGPSPEPTEEPSPSPEPTPTPTPTPTPEPTPTPTPEPTPEPTPSYTVYDAPLPFTAVASKGTSQFLVSSGQPTGVSYSKGTSFTITSRVASRFGVVSGGLYMVQLAYLDLVSYTSSFRSPSRSPGSQIVDFYGPQMDELRDLLGW